MDEKMTTESANPAAWVAYDAATEAGWTPEASSLWAWRTVVDGHGGRVWIYANGAVTVISRYMVIPPRDPRTPDDWRDLAARCARARDL